MNRLLLAAVLLAPAAHAAAPESLSAGAAAAFAQSPALLRPAVKASSMLSEDFSFELQPALKPQPAHAGALGAELARAKLADALDKNLHVKNYLFGSRSLDLGVATDAAFKTYFLTFSDKDGTALRPVGELGKLKDQGVDIQIDASTRYNFRAKMGSIFDDPRRNSDLYMTALSGGPSYDEKTGVIIDAIRAQAIVFNIGDEEYWAIYGRDVKTDGSGFADTRSLLFIHLGTGFTRPKAWPLAESSLTPDVASAVSLDGVQLNVTRTSGGELVLQQSDN